MNFSFNCVCVCAYDWLFVALLLFSIYFVMSQLRFLIYFIPKATDRKLALPLPLRVHWKSQVVKFYRKFDHLTLTLAQNVREAAEKKTAAAATLSKPTVPSKALLRYTQWASQSHDKTFLEFIVESRASSLNEFLTLRISGPKTSDSFSIASLLSLCAHRGWKCEKHLPFSWLILFLRPLLTHHTTWSFFLPSQRVCVSLSRSCRCCCAHLILFQLLNASIRVFRAQFHLLYNSHSHTHPYIHWLSPFLQCMRLSGFLLLTLAFIAATTAVRVSVEMECDERNEILNQYPSYVAWWWRELEGKVVVMVVWSCRVALDDSAYFNFAELISWVIVRHHTIKFSRRRASEATNKYINDVARNAHILRVLEWGSRMW